MNTTRMQFLRKIIIATIAIATSFQFVANAAVKPGRGIGLQLYTLRDEFGKSSVEDVLAKVAKAGYKFVEPYGYSRKKGFWGLSPQEFKALLDKYKLTSNGGHYDFFSIVDKGINYDDLESYIAAAKVLKQEYIIVPYVDPKLFDTEAGVKAFAEKLKVVSEVVKKNGLKLAYHNHSFEFKDLGGKTGYEILLKELAPSVIDFEIDLYWAVRGNQDVFKIFENNKGRFAMWHIKDRKKTDASKNTEIGNGDIDYVKILKAAKLAGIKYSIVEQENFDIDPYESIAKSNQYLKSIK